MGPGNPRRAEREVAIPHLGLGPGAHPLPGPLLGAPLTPSFSSPQPGPAHPACLYVTPHTCSALGHQISLAVEADRQDLSWWDQYSIWWVGNSVIKYSN